jgi:hypothetical protein
MARVVFVWEQGTALGHLTHLRLPMQVAQDMGHEVILVARELGGIPEVLAGLRFGLMQAPFKQKVPKVDQASCLSFTHLIGQQCFASAQELVLYLRAWRSIFDLLQPDVVCFEHSPTALIAAWPYRFTKALFGSGFTLPQFDTRHGLLQPFPTTVLDAAMVSRLRLDDQRLLAVVNEALGVMGDPVMVSLASVYGQAQLQLLQTWPALDPFGPRASAKYLGIEVPTRERKPDWPNGPGPKVFGYLHHFVGLAAFLSALQQRGARALLVVHGLPESIRAAYINSGIVFLDTLLDVASVAAEVDWVVHHGNHGTSAAFLTHGVAQLMIPLHQEHLFGAMRLVGQQAGLMAFQDQTDFRAAVAAMEQPSLKAGAALAGSMCEPYQEEKAVEYLKHFFTQIA